MVLDMGEEEDDKPIILGRQFLNTTNAIIYVGSRQVHFQFSREKVHCYFNSYTIYVQPKKNRSRRRRRSSHRQELKKNRSKRRRRSSRRQENQPRWNEWEDKETEEPVKDEPTPLKSSPLTKVKPIDQAGMERKGDTITITRSTVI
jgi:hypothetical protein